MKAIRTRYSGPTNTRGSRFHATDSDGNRVSISYPYELNHDDASELAAYLLMRKMNWNCELVGGGFGPDTFWVMLPYDRERGIPAWQEFFAREDRKVYAISEVL